MTAPGREQDPLADVLAKSASGSGLGRPETLTEHSAATMTAAAAVARRIGHAGLLARYPGFWEWAAMAALLHDAGKVAAGFQRQLLPGRESWGERHEVLSLAYADLFTAGLASQDRAMVTAGIAFHHRCLAGGRPGQALRELYPADAAWERKFGHDPSAPAAQRVQVPVARHQALLAWLAAKLGVSVPEQDDRRLWQRARDTFAQLACQWQGPVTPEEGLIAVLLQGAVTLADHAASAAVRLDDYMPLPTRYLTTLAHPYPHQVAAAAAPGHLMLMAPTGSGKTEAGLAWASGQMGSMPGLPRLAWLLPYRASIDAAADRLAAELAPQEGQPLADIGRLHGTVAASLLADATADDRGPGPADARKARARARQMRLFAQRVRVATPHQLLRAALAGPRHSSALIEQANCLIVLDELHAYDPATFGRICAAMRLWETLGSRIAVLSATLAPPMTQLVSTSLSRPVAIVRAPAALAAPRHRLILDEQPLTSPTSLDRVREWLAEGRSVLAVANTVRAAQHVFRELTGDATALASDPDTALLLHSRFRYQDRASVEARIKARYPERQPGDPPFRSPGLVVATQALEVSLCLDFDRGITQLAPVEAIAQRAGRVNRRGRHPDGPTEFRVHATDTPHPYDPGAVAAARHALSGFDSALISEEAINTWLSRAYDTAWGQDWAEQARYHRDAFASAFLTFTEPFADRSEFAARLEQEFDTTEILHADDVRDYDEQVRSKTGDPLLATRLLIPVRWVQRYALYSAGRAWHDPRLGIWITDAPYDPRTGLDIDALRPTTPETIL